MHKQNIDEDKHQNLMKLVKILQTAVEDQDSDIRKLKKGKGNILEKFNQVDSDLETRLESLERRFRTEQNYDLKWEFD